jgi:hypothetical protein
MRTPMPLELTVRLFSIPDAIAWLSERGHRMPAGQLIEYKLFMNYFPILRRRGLEPLRFGRSWMIPENEMIRLEQLWTNIAEK